MTRVRHETDGVEGFYESELLVASDRNQIQISLITANKRGEEEPMTVLADYIVHQYQFTFLGWREFQNIFSRPNVLWKALHLKGAVGGMCRLMTVGIIGMAPSHTWLDPKAKKIPLLPLHRPTCPCSPPSLCGLTTSGCICPTVLSGHRHLPLLLVSQVWDSYCNSYPLLLGESFQNAADSKTSIIQSPRVRNMEAV